MQPSIDKTRHSSDNPLRVNRTEAIVADTINLFNYILV